MRRLIEKVKSHNRQAIIIYVDFEKAFGSVHRGMLMKILKAFDTTPKLLKAIAKMYENTKAKVVTPDGETDFFEIKAGVLQGDTLAPYFFAIVLDYVIQETYRGRKDELGFKLQKRKSSRHPAITITSLDLAHDIALITKEMDQTQKVLVK